MNTSSSVHGAYCLCTVRAIFPRSITLHLQSPDTTACFCLRHSGFPGPPGAPPWYLLAPSLQLNISCCSRAPSSAFISGCCALLCHKPAPRTEHESTLILLPDTCISPLSLQVLPFSNKGSVRCSSVCTYVIVTLVCFLLGL